LLEALGEHRSKLAGLHAPTGLDVGGDGPHAIALSVLAEIHAVLHQRTGGKLRDRRGPIHARAA
jgi:xanthine/CO dehydrogenase XdhC/CoxF family maturation factor